MSEQPELSVVIPCHDAAATIELQLQALANQRGAADFEVIVVDNRSTDSSRDTVDRWQGRVPGLRIVSAPELPGAGYARNVGVAAARADKLLFCDADDLVAPDWVDAGAAALDQVDLACGVDITLPEVAFDSLEAMWAEHFPVALSDRRVQLRAKPSSYPIVLGGNLAIRRGTYLELGGYDASMTLGNEDNDLAVRAEQAGHLIHRAPAMRIAIRERADLRGVYRRARVAARGHIQLVDRHDLRDSSPHLRDGAWRFDLPRSLAATAAMVTKPGEQRDWPAIATRLGAAVGLWEGEWRSRRTGFGAPDLGRGLQPTGEKR
ncbi:glycosyltransferase family 2 protein [Yimella sp. cx-573]|nr:glycosyltransferase family 2 protein [Yimella sp. cx-573]